MTPLAQAIVSDYAQPIRARQFTDHAGVQPRMLDAHCFECSDIFENVSGMAQGLAARNMTARGVGTFLPAPKTWLEWRRGNATQGFMREGVLLEAEDGDEIATATWCCRGEPGPDADLFLSSPSVGALMLSGEGSLDSGHYLVRPFREMDQGEQNGWTCFLYVLLAMINTPRIIGRRQHMPHAGLQRKLAKARGVVGKYPLHAWHELVLEVTAPQIDGSGPHEAMLTGRRAMHFCRKYMRVRLGRVEWVSAHWRGDASLGMKQTRYRMVPGEAA